MAVLVYLLTLLQKILTEYGIIEYISRFLKPVMIFFGLSPKTSFLWLVSNTLGLAYGAGIMIEEAEKGETTQEENDLLNHHIGISHSNLEDLLLFAAAGGSYLWMLLSRWLMSLILVWERKLEIYIGITSSRRRGRRDAGTQGRRVTGSQGRRDAGSQGHRVVGS